MPPKTLRFFKITTKLPMEMQMLVCNKVYGLGNSIVKKKYSDLGFIKFGSSLGEKYLADPTIRIEFEGLKRMTMTRTIIDKEKPMC